VVVAALALAVGSLVRGQSDADVRDSALEAARVYSTSLTTFDARTLDEDAERVRRASTEQFAEQYDASIADLRATVDAEQTVSTGTVVGAGLEQLDGGTATVLVAVNQQLAGTTGEPRTEANRLRMVLERRDGRWLIGSVERL
jgi:Mce-associated membrane protein